MVEKIMNTVKIESYSWIAGTMGNESIQNQKVKKSVQAGTTVYDLFCEMAANYPEFSKQVFNPSNGQLSDQVMVIMNGRLLQSADLKTTVLKDNDKITLSPVLVGG
jgi:sulfur carrier protein ThiS